MIERIPSCNPAPKMTHPKRTNATLSPQYSFCLSEGTGKKVSWSVFCGPMDETRGAKLPCRRDILGRGWAQRISASRVWQFFEWPQPPQWIVSVATLAEVRRILVSVKFVSAILGPEMGAPILWTPGKMRSFCRENHVRKIPLFWGGFWGGGECRFYFYGRADFSEEERRG